MTSRVRLFVFCSLVFLLTSALFAQTLRFDPPNRTAHHSVDAIAMTIDSDPDAALLVAGFC